VCILDESGAVVFEGRCPSQPMLLAQLITAKAPRVGLETGPTSIWLYHLLAAAGLPVVCLDARQALSVRPTKTDRNDARGLAEMVRMGWYREVRVKSLAAQEQRALLITRHRLVAMRRELDNQIRGLLKPFGLVVGSGNSGSFAKRAQAMAASHPVLSPLLDRLLEVRRAVLVHVAALDKQIRGIVRANATLRRFLSVPGVGPVTALAFLSAIDDPSRFARARDVGPYLGLTPRRYQSGEIDRAGRISKQGDRFTRTCLYEAANVLLSKVRRWSPLKAWGQRLATRIGAKKAKVAIARKLAVAC
jgi:transposase